MSSKKIDNFKKEVEELANRFKEQSEEEDRIKPQNFETLSINYKEKFVPRGCTQPLVTLEEKFDKTEIYTTDYNQMYKLFDGPSCDY